MDRGRVRVRVTVKGRYIPPLHFVQTGFTVHLASYPMIIGYISPGVNPRSVKLKSHLQLVTM
jgi:hypothetical protein